MAAPTRLDVHQLSDVASWLDQADDLGAVRLIVDLSQVRFIDHAAIDALNLLSRSSSIDVQLVNPSAAYSLTACLVGQKSQSTGHSSLTVQGHDGVVSDAHRLTSLSSKANGRSDGATNPACNPLLIAVTGDLTVAHAHEFRANFTQLIEDNDDDREVVIDLGDIDRLDAAGLAAVTAMLFALRRAGRRISVREPRRPEPAQFARLTGILPMLAAGTTSDALSNAHA